MKRELLLTLLVVAASCGCAKAGSREEELPFLRAILPDSLLDYAHLEVGSTNGVTVVGEGQARHLGLHVFPGQSKVNRGIRAEISVDYPFEPGETIRYSWRFMLPKGFISDAPRNRWWVIGQWHDQPNRRLGETWETFPGLSPPVMLGLGELEGRLALGLTYGPTHEKRKSQTVGPRFVERGKWHHLAVVIRWSRGPDGKASVFLDDLSQPSMVAEGANMNNDYQHYLKVGMYRHPDIATDNWIYVDDLEISRSSAP